MTPDPAAVADNSIERMLIVRLGAMGDIIHTLPAVTGLRLAFPRAEIGWIIEERWAELLCTLPTPRSGPCSPQRPLVDHVHTVNTQRWRKAKFASGTWEQIASTLSDVRGRQYQVAVDLQGAVRSALLARWSGAPVIFGMRQPRETAAGMFYTRLVMPKGTHVVQQFLAVAEAVAATPLPIPTIQLPCDPSAEQACERMLSHLGITEFALLNPGAGWGAKQWPAERYGAVAEQLSQSGLKSLINYGPGEESLARSVENSSGGTAKAITSSLPQLIAFTRRAHVFIGGDTGPMHLASALQIPVVGIFGPTNPARNGPFGTKNTVLRSLSSPTDHSRRAEPDPGLLEITPEKVVAAVRQLLEQFHV